MVRNKDVEKIRCPNCNMDDVELTETMVVRGMVIPSGFCYVCSSTISWIRKPKPSATRPRKSSRKLLARPPRNK